MFRNLLVLFAILLTPNVALANVGLPVVMLGFPFVVLMLIPVILIECWMFRRLAGISWRQSWKAVTFANVVTTLIGYPFSWLLQFAIQMSLSFALSGVSYNSPILQNPIVASLGFAFGAAWLMPFDSEMWWMLPVAGIVGLVPAYFISVLLEYLAIDVFLKVSVKNMRGLLYRANLASYTFLFLILVGILGWNFYKHGPIGPSPVRVAGANISSVDGETKVIIFSDADLKTVMDVVVKQPHVTSLDSNGLESVGGYSRIGELTKLTSLNLSSSKITDEELKSLARLTALKRLVLRSTSINGSGFADFPIMEGLTELDLDSTQFTDENIKYLVKFPNVHKLDFSATPVTGTGLKYLVGMKVSDLDFNGSKISDEGALALKDLKSVQYLSLANTATSDLGLRGLEDLPKLHSLHLWQTKVTDNGLKSVGKITSLKTLSINLPAITDLGLAHIAGLTNLEVLDLSRSGVRGPGLKHLYGMKSLKRLWLVGTDVSDADVNALKAALPGAEVFRQ